MASTSNTLLGLAIAACCFVCTKAFLTGPQTQPNVHRQMNMSLAAGSGVRKVVVTGAGGRTGSMVYQKLLAVDGVETLGLVRSKKSAKKLIKKAGGSQQDNIILGDVLDTTSLADAMKGADAVVLCSSATPSIVFSSIVKIMVKKMLRNADPGRPKFTWPKSSDGKVMNPSVVDWEGAKNQIDAAKAAGVKHFVFVSSMGGTQKDNFLNSIGKQEDGSGGDILLWKRKAEEYLIASGLDYTIVHPGGLTDKAGGERELLLGVDDYFLENATNRSVPREDVAEVCVQSLFSGEVYKNKSFDLVSKEVGDGAPTTDFQGLIAALGDKTCNYA